MTLTGFFSKLKKTFEDSAKKVARDNGAVKQKDESLDDEIQTENLSFKSAEKVYEFMLDVIQSLVQDRGKLAQLFKDM